MPTLADPLAHWARTAEDRPVLTWHDFDERIVTLTYGELYDQARRVAGGLAAEGLRPGDRCLLHTGNSVTFMIGFWALQLLGATAIPTIADYSPEELRYVLQHSGAWGVITRPELHATTVEALDGVPCRLVVDGSGNDVELTLDELAGAEPASAKSNASPADVGLILYTSGTTANPKGVMLGHAGAVYTATCYAQHLRLLPRDRVLTCLPLFHVNGLFLQMMPTVVSGAHLVLTPRFSVSRYWSWIERHGVTVAHLVAGPVRLLLADEKEPGSHDVRTMTFGLPLETEEIDAFERRFGISLAMVWGLTETCCGGTLMPIGFGRRPGHQQIGPAMVGWDVSVVDDEFRQLADGSVGELVVRSPGNMLGYLDDPSATEHALRDGWVRTGDLGRRDSDGYFEFVDRIKDMLKPSGENVAASEIENVILGLAGVEECAVVGVSDPVRTESVVAFVVVGGDGSLSVDDVLAVCRARLARFKVPSRVEFCDQLPKTSIGKVRKGQLREQLEQE